MIGGAGSGLAGAVVNLLLAKERAAWAELHAERGPGRTIKVMHPDGTQSEVPLNDGMTIDGECVEVPTEPKRIVP